MQTILFKTIQTHGVEVKLFSLDGGQTWHRPTFESIKTSVPMPGLPPVNATSRGTSPGIEQGRKVNISRRKFSKNAKLRAASEEGSTLKRLNQREAARKHIESSIGTHYSPEYPFQDKPEPQLVYLREDTGSPARKRDQE